MPASSAVAPEDEDAPAGWGRWRSITVQALRPKRLYEQIAEQIEQIVQRESLRPGDQLPPERELAQMLGVSRPSVREAMIALETAGLIEVRTGDGTYVASPAPGRGFRLSSQRGDDPGPGALEQFQARALIEPALARLAAEIITPPQVDVLDNAVRRADALFQSGQLADAEDHLFHVKLAEFSGNLILASLVRQLWEMRASELWRTLRARVVQPGHRTMVIQDRMAVVQALRTRDGASAERHMRRLLRRAHKRYFE